MKRKESKRKIDKIWETHHNNKNKLEEKKSSIRRQIRAGWLKTRKDLYPSSEYELFDSFSVSDYIDVYSDDGITFHPGDD